MTFLIKVLEQGWMMWLCGICGDALTLTGIVFAALNQSVAGFSPIVWILLGMVFYFYFVMSLLARILVKISGTK
ncbi:MAG: hypothetical protein JXA01_01785 [Dehalococcoidia bacterium]|nr:hypothetical protein [Dehalococcoidia bacterium]